MRTRRASLSVALVLLLLVGLIGSVGAAPKQKKYFGNSEELGKGSARAFIELQADATPLRFGVVFDKHMLKDLPEEPNRYSRCYDVDQDGALDEHECIGDYELILNVPAVMQEREDLPFEYVGLNWNPHGHVPPAPPAWSLPHFDFHFYTMPYQEVQQIRTGSCGELINCDDFARATAPVPQQYMPEHHINVGAAVARMGNHLINTQAPELQDPEVRFTHTFIYGSYDSHITFYEPMITHEFLSGKPNVCTALNLPQAWEQSGYYPTEYCINFDVSSGNEYTVTLQGFVYREAE